MKKKLLAKICAGMRLDKLILRNVFRKTRSIKIVVYHRILADLPCEDFPFDSDLVSATVDEFRQQMHYLTQNYDVISFSDVDDFIRTGKGLPKNPVLVTLDDGYVDNYEFAFPVIREYQVPSTLFITTDYMDSDKTFWFDWLACIVFGCKEKYLYLGEEYGSYDLSGSRSYRTEVFYKIIRLLCQVDNQERLSLLDEMNNRYGDTYDNLDEGLKDLSRPMRWWQVRKMSDAGVCIGSHTKSHPILSRLNKVELLNELVQSKKNIEQNINKEVTVIAYPNGQKKDYTVEVKELAGRAGYRFGVNYIHGVNKVGQLHSLDLNRLHVYPSHDMNMFKMVLSKPSMF